MKEELLAHLSKVASHLGVDTKRVNIEYTETPTHGDFASSVALASAKDMKMSPKTLAEKLVVELEKSAPDFVEKIEVAGPGFINFTVKDMVLAKKVVSMSEEHFSQLKRHFSRLKRDGVDRKKVMVEYTDPNTFKVFHIGHLMSNAIGESISRLIEHAGSEVVRICYPSDIGLHIAKSLWAMKKHYAEIPKESSAIQMKTEFLGKMYVEGTNAYEENPDAKAEIDTLNKVIYEESDPELKKLFETGRKWSLEHFELLYGLLGTKFDETIYESSMAPIGLKIVRENIDKVFEKSDGAIIFKGEEFGLHTRVFVNSHGLPTYEAKELGLNVTKFAKHPDAVSSISITANEQNEYFRVISKAISLLDKKNGGKLKHIGHGMLRFSSGKMSSRKGNVISAESLIDDVKKMVAEKMVGREFAADEADETADMVAVAVAAVKYSILRQGIGGDVIFDPATSISFEGDSGPYLQYSAVRAQSVLAKVSDELKLGKNEKSPKLQEKFTKLPEKVGLLERLIVRFPDVASRAREEYAPQHVANYLINLAGAFNAFYANTTILDEADPLTPYRVALTRSFLDTMTDGLWLLGIKVPKRM